MKNSDVVIPNLLVVWDGFPLGEKKCAEKFYVELTRFPEYKSALWGVKQYKDNQPKLTSSQKIIFFGKSVPLFFEEIKSKTEAISDWEFNELGMQYGWKGNICVITAEGMVIGANIDKQKEFFALYDIIQQKYPNRLKYIGEPIWTPLIWKYQYDLLTCKFIEEDLKNFMEG